MNDSTKFSFTGRLRSITHAISGLILMLRSQQNAWVHLIATLSAIGFGLLFGIAKSDWALLLLVIIIVWVAEALNTAFEFLCDVTNPEFHPVVKQAKDISAGAVLISAIGAVLVGLIVFVPHIYNMLSGNALQSFTMK